MENKKKFAKRIVLGKSIDAPDKLCPKCDSPMNYDPCEEYDWICTNKDCEFILTTSDS